jgi:hypothetical protein
LLLLLLLLLLALLDALCRWDEPKFPLRRPIQETINKIAEIMGHIEDDLKVRALRSVTYRVGCACGSGGGMASIFSNGAAAAAAAAASAAAWSMRMQVQPLVHIGMLGSSLGRKPMIAEKNRHETVVDCL